jgi:hypothetical protein
VRKVPELLASVALQVLGRRTSVVVDRLGVGVGLKAGTLVGLVVAALWGTGAERMVETRTKLCLCSVYAR